ncbi:MAG: hypothetical protein M3N08_07150 [Pseudomonadota bacterium]|nr:hypothetical protein [Pseudomonadota bacterium]
MKKPLTALALTAALTLAISSAAFAEDMMDPGHPRVNEVEQRIDNQENRVNAGVADGQINAHEAAKDDARLNREQATLNADEAKHNGHITRHEQRHLNKRLTRGSHRIHHQRHRPATN